MGFVFNNKDPLTATFDDLNTYFDIGTLKEQTVKVSDIEEKILAIKKMPIDNEIKCQIINEYNSLKSAKSVKEKKKIEKRLSELLKKNGL